MLGDGANSSGSSPSEVAVEQEERPNGPVNDENVASTDSARA